MKKKIHLTESQFKYLLNETEFNYHLNRNSNKEHSLEPYQSDSKYQMDGRGTGHFGSGTYFSTYKDEDPQLDAEYGNNNPNKDERFIQIGDGIYRVNLDLYKNLYRVRNQRQADVLYSLLRYLDQMFCRMTWMGKLDKDANYDNADLYQRIKRNAHALNLKCPSYYSLTRMMQEHGTNDKRQSFSTVFMEYNGYNGVNVSGIPMYDNTLHGSVIYDLTKLGDDSIEEVQPNSLWNVSGSYQNTTVQTPQNGELWDDELNALEGKSVFWLSKINDLPLPKALRLLKNYIKGNGDQLDKYTLKSMNPELKRRYLRMLFKSNSNKIDVSKLAETIEEENAWYWVNYVDEYYKKSGLIALLNQFEWDLDWDASEEENDKLRQEFLNKLMIYANRDLEPFEKKWMIDNRYLKESDEL